VMGRSEHTSQATAFQGADVTNVMGRSILDLRDATLAPGANTTVHVFSAMGNVTVRVPPAWTVEPRAVSALGAVRDERAKLPEAEATVSPAPRLVLRGLIVFGRLTITS
jgi:predicted membrane protein